MSDLYQVKIQGLEDVKLTTDKKGAEKLLSLWNDSVNIFPFKNKYVEVVKKRKAGIKKPVNKK